MSDDPNEHKPLPRYLWGRCMPDSGNLDDAAAALLKLRALILAMCASHADPLRDCDYLLSLPRLVPGKAYRN
jgi:hypothetical protein